MKNILYIIIAIVLIGGSYFVFNKKQAAAPSVTETQVVPEAKQDTTPTSITKAEIAKHNSAASCYSIISAKVYDLTNWINKHPGGKQAILGICGKDGTEAFVDQHGDNQRQQDVLVTYFIGNLAQ